MDPASDHIPVLLDQLIEHAGVRPGDTVIDGTFGNGGHARALVAQLDGRGTYIGIDRDPSVTARFEDFATGASGIETRFLRMTFPEGFRALAHEGVSANVVILDVGVSSMQLDQPERGFAYSYDAPLDMRMDPSAGLTAHDLVNEASEDELARILREYGEERFARRIARELVRRREIAPIERTGQLVEAIRVAVPAAAARSGGHPAKRTFQALRIAVNDELGMLDRGLDSAFDLLAPRGRLVVIAFHSLEDRIVKQRFVAWQGRCTCPPGLPVCVCGCTAVAETMTRRPVAASVGEVAANARAASARLRVASKLATGTGTGDAKDEQP